ncbi:hypothetical protein SDRG_00254 [Saprolegnia diclina VS20]|uniref:PDZ domain-containing protein n=2 Tax=Saprolegnia TaxID=4769 RepID=T0R6I8_SAPDV|nr:hypothetical protein SDRG_00254 [Saprolegnia diclina VS20]EQC42521.1 hypothetical protein SDRG_00254 [Saprolegnia diclina VS20]|eukprot:XP_008603944.1 hypothetical protein SDRG_00254 [Saprolegnia diclina VS20]
MEYQVSWGEGSLGLTLRPDLGEDMPPVVGRITREDSAAAKAGVAVGHMLVSINGMDTARRGYDATVEMLKTIHRPAILRFRIPKSLLTLGARNSTGAELDRRREHSSSSSHREYRRGVSSAAALGTSRGESYRIERDREREHREREHRRRSERDSERERANAVVLPPPVLAHSSSTSSEASTVSATSSTSAPVKPRRETYTVVWTEGPLGMIFRPDDDDCHIPCIRKITGKGVGTSGIDRARVGDILLVINGQDTKEIGFRSSISLLKSITKPAVLKFKRMRRRPSRKRGEEAEKPSVASVVLDSARPNVVDTSLYDIVWREGELGLKLKPTPADVPMISRLTGRGSASGLHNAHVGDVLVSVNGKTVDGASYTGTLRLLKHTPKPAILRFRPSAREVDPPRAATPKREQIPLDVAKQLVATSQGLDPLTDAFAGVLLSEIVDGTKEAHLIRVAAKAYVAAQAEKKRGEKKEALTRAEREAQVLAEALERVKEEAKKYEEYLALQQRERILRSATENKPVEVIGQQNNMLAQLASVITPFRRENYETEDESFAAAAENSAADDTAFDQYDMMRQSILEDLSHITKTALPTKKARKTCAECHCLESLAVPFFLDDDGQWYCTSCWEAFYGEPIVVADNATVHTTIVEEDEDQDEATTDEAPAPLPKGGLYRRPSTREDLLHNEVEERNARLEAEKMLHELEELRKSGGNPVHHFNGHRSSSSSDRDRMEREKRGKEELARMLKAEEDKARADGKEELARKLQAQRERSDQDLQSIRMSAGDDPKAVIEEGDEAADDDDAPSEFAHFYKPDLQRSRSDSHMKMRQVSTPEPPMRKTFGNDDSHRSPSKMSVSSFDDDEHHYTMDDEDEEEEDDEFDKDAELLRAREEQNFAMAKQLEEAHEVVKQARMSMIMMGDGDIAEFTGLSDDQINLFKKLTMEADERMSMLDPSKYDDSDSDEEEEEGDGVWI